jgi:hypothetical protein
MSVGVKDEYNIHAELTVAILWSWYQIKCRLMIQVSLSACDDV